jgi:hypothetical protein
MIAARIAAIHFQSPLTSPIAPDSLTRYRS